MDCPGILFGQTDRFARRAGGPHLIALLFEHSLGKLQDFLLILYHQAGLPAACDQ